MGAEKSTEKNMAKHTSPTCKPSIWWLCTVSNICWVVIFEGHLAHILVMFPATKHKSTVVGNWNHRWKSHQIVLTYLLTHNKQIARLVHLVKETTNILKRVQIQTQTGSENGLALRNIHPIWLNKDVSAIPSCFNFRPVYHHVQFPRISMFQIVSKQYQQPIVIISGW